MLTGYDSNTLMKVTMSLSLRRERNIINKWVGGERRKGGSKENEGGGEGMKVKRRRKGRKERERRKEREDLLIADL